LGWQWTSANPSLGTSYRIYYNGNQYGGQLLPKNTTPGLKPKGADTILVNLYNCSSHPQQVTITVKDTLNQTYQFVIKPPS
jgi:hypothetical protein